MVNLEADMLKEGKCVKKRDEERRKRNIKK
jgi:hypothetical protein